MKESIQLVEKLFQFQGHKNHHVINIHHTTFSHAPSRPDTLYTTYRHFC